ncbi:MAG: methyltransferase domain-containing protein [Acidimicrobiales bacterium]|nr:methyltransferase domain-containing protein [Acidimicrobiales bacterium]
MGTNTWACPACGAPATTVVYEQDGIPVNSMLLLDEADDAHRFPTASMRLVLCNGCGFLFNAAFDAELAEYSGRYEASQAYSARFNDFAVGLATRWIQTHDIRNRTVLEIGCDKGDFLALMCELGPNSGIGVDPAAAASRQAGSPAADRMEFIADFYDERFGHLDADVVICRHTLEHIQPVEQFMSTIRRAIGDRTDTLVLFELPDVVRVLEDLAFWDVYYEHCSYFSLGSLARLFRRTGFEVLHLETDFDDQYLMIEARPSTVPAVGVPLPVEDDLGRIEKAATRFHERCGASIQSWRDGVRARLGRGERVVIWGGGSKGVAYLSALGFGDALPYAVDINPHKQGKYLAGSGVLVVGPEFLTEYEPSLVIAMNPIYCDEIRAELDRLGVAAEVMGA